MQNHVQPEGNILGTQNTEILLCDDVQYDINAGSNRWHAYIGSAPWLINLLISGACQIRLTSSSPDLKIFPLFFFT